jgi:hypothetical protein
MTIDQEILKAYQDIKDQKLTRKAGAELISELFTKKRSLLNEKECGKISIGITNSQRI